MEKVENTKRYDTSEKYYDYHIIVIGQNELAYSVAVCDVDSGNAEWSLYAARIYMNYLCEYIEKLRSWMMKAGYEECLDMIDIIASPKFKYTIISE